MIENRTNAESAMMLDRAIAAMRIKLARSPRNGSVGIIVVFHDGKVARYETSRTVTESVGGDHLDAKSQAELEDRVIVALRAELASAPMYGTVGILVALQNGLITRYETSRTVSYKA